MGLHVYCITYAGHEPGVPGVAGETVAAVDAGALAAWASSHAERPRPALDALREHDAVVRAAMTPLVTPVPLRFGQWLESTEALHARLAERADHWAELLTAFAGAVEMGVRIAPAAPAAVPAAITPEPRPRSGREYLEQLAARAHHGEQDAAGHARALAMLRSALGDLVLREVHGAVPDGPDSLWVAHLVRRDRTGVYREAVAALAGSELAYRFRLTGPWPPYSFAT